MLIWGTETHLRFFSKGGAVLLYPNEALNKSQPWFDTFSVRPECRAQRGVSKGRTENADETTSHLTKPLKRQVIGYHHERSYSALP
jgi:hypothetical protein